VEKEGRVPKQSEEVEGVKLGQFWTNVTQGGCSTLYQTLLSHNTILREGYERGQQLKEEKKGKEILTPEERARRLLAFVEREGRVPKFSEEVEGVKLGYFWNDVKQGQCSNLYPTLSHNPILRQDYERIQLLKQQKQQKDSD
jgi:hypothetical protein